MWCKIKILLNFSLKDIFIRLKIYIITHLNFFKILLFNLCLDGRRERTRKELFKQNLVIKF